MFTKRTGIIIWVNDIKSAKSLERFGTIHYISKKLQYVVLYLNEDKLQETNAAIQKLPFVKKVEPSFRNEIKTEYNSNIPDKTRFYSY